MVMDEYNYIETTQDKQMYKAEIVHGKPVILLDGEIVEKGFNWLAEAQERADELNEES